MLDCLANLLEFLVGAEEERLVAAVVQLWDVYRASYLEAVLVVVQNLLLAAWSGSKHICIQGSVLHILVDRAVKIVCAVLADQVDVDSEIRAVLRCVVAALHLGFRDHIRSRVIRGGRDQVVHDGDAIEGEGVLNLALAGAYEVFTGRVALVVGR